MNDTLLSLIKYDIKLLIIKPITLEKINRNLKFGDFVTISTMNEQDSFSININNENKYYLYNIIDLIYIFTIDTFNPFYFNLEEFNNYFFLEKSIKWFGKQGFIELNENIKVIIENIIPQAKLDCETYSGYKVTLIKKDGTHITSNEFIFNNYFLNEKCECEFDGYVITKNNNYYDWFKKEPDFYKLKSYKNSILEYINLWK